MAMETTAAESDKSLSLFRNIIDEYSVFEKFAIVDGRSDLNRCSHVSALLRKFCTREGTIWDWRSKPWALDSRGTDETLRHLS